MIQQYNLKNLLDFQEFLFLFSKIVSLKFNIYKSEKVILNLYKALKKSKKDPTIFLITYFFSNMPRIGVKRGYKRRRRFPYPVVLKKKLQYLLLIQWLLSVSNVSNKHSKLNNLFLEILKLESEENSLKKIQKKHFRDILEARAFVFFGR